MVALASCSTFEAMPADPYRLAFAALCILCALAILTGAFMEIARARRGESLLAPWHFRLRLISAVIWVIILFSVVSLVTVLWPGVDPTREKVLRAATVLGGVLWLVVVALLVLGGDMYFLMRARRRAEHAQAIRFSQELHALADKESARLRAEQAANQSGTPRNSSHD
jgi:Na+/proline symporter